LKKFNSYGDAARRLFQGLRLFGCSVVLAAVVVTVAAVETAVSVIFIALPIIRAASATIAEFSAA
jgi:hypothetical protein